MADSAKGPLAGYLYQFEKGLLLLVGLENKSDYITIEEFDDLSSHSENGTVLFTMQAKHSISSSATTFQDTSYALWRTFEIWIEKLSSGIFTSNTQFICATNKIIPADSLLRKIKNQPFDEGIQLITDLLKVQETKLLDKKLKKGDAPTIQKNVSQIKYALQNLDKLKIVLHNLILEDNDKVQEIFITKLHLSADSLKQTVKENIYNSFYGWLTLRSKALWNHSKVAKFTKLSFDEQWATINSNSTLVNSVFRTKEVYGTLPDEKIAEKKNELFVTQIEDLPRRQAAKELIVKKAIQDYILSELEELHIVKKGDFAESDFTAFKDLCKESWQDTYDRIIIKELDEYNEEQKVELGIQIFDKIMHETELKFKEGYVFTTNNSYLRNGNFLKLSNEPCIGWHPDWKKLYDI